jgi:hypothetical protein
MRLPNPEQYLYLYIHISTGTPFTPRRSSPPKGRHRRASQGREAPCTLRESRGWQEQPPRRHHRWHGCQSWSQDGERERAGPSCKKSRQRGSQPWHVNPKAEELRISRSIDPDVINSTVYIIIFYPVLEGMTTPR